MSDDGALFPFEFHLVGTPVSLQGQAKSKERWRGEVQEAARQRIAQTVEWVYGEDVPLSVTIYYFPAAPMDGDIDNIVKPIMDALIGCVYLDDRTVERIVAQKFEPDAVWEFVEPSEQLVAALDNASASESAASVVYVQVVNDLSWRRL